MRLLTVIKLTMLESVAGSGFMTVHSRPCRMGMYEHLFQSQHHHTGYSRYPLLQCMNAYKILYIIVKCMCEYSGETQYHHMLHSCPPSLQFILHPFLSGYSISLTPTLNTTFLVFHSPSCVLQPPQACLGVCQCMEYFFLVVFWRGDVWGWSYLII